jgi:PBP1b-binding outer membrane lipoprotein LpoB
VIPQILEEPLPLPIDNLPRAEYRRLLSIAAQDRVSSLREVLASYADGMGALTDRITDLMRQRTALGFGNPSATRAISEAIAQVREEKRLLIAQQQAVVEHSNKLVAEWLAAVTK